MPVSGATLRTRLPAGLAPLEELALDLRWTWSHAGDELWKSIDAETWERTGNPYVILQNLGAQQLQALDGDAAFMTRLRELVASHRQYLAREPAWRPAAGDGSLQRIAYFSLEFGLAGALPLYAGGLGVLAGDYLKAASDLGLPLVGVGLLYQEGYFRQVLDEDGGQQAVYPFNDPDALPITRVLDERGAWLSVPVEFPGREVRFRVWRAQVGRVPLYLLDSNDPRNGPVDRGIAGKLYGGGPEVRLMQEIALGIGGWRLLEALGLEVDICHLNEGHAAFAALERARSFMEQQRVAFWDAVWATRAGNVFTTHTTVAAAFDLFDLELLAKYGRAYATSLGVPVEQIVALGQAPGRSGNGFNMAFLAARLCASCNGVSRLHGEVSRTVFAGLYPRWPLVQVPIGHVTNGVHVPSWDSSWSDAAWTAACGKERWLGANEDACAAIEQLPDEALWSLRGRQRGDLVGYARRRLARQLAQRGAHAGDGTARDPEAIAAGVLDPNALTLGFARRFTGYKRPNLLLRDPARLVRLLTHAQRPVQLIVAGKAHPADDAGRMLLQQWVQLASTAALRDRIVFLEDYDIALAQEIVAGVDVWINTPRRPWEACGTSGMKVLVNGGLNLSVLDGWWAEAWEPAVGWAIPEPPVARDDDALDEWQARTLYELLETEVVPEFYRRDAAGLPREWIARMRASMSRLAPRFSTNRMLREYVERIYLPAARLHVARTRDRGHAGGELRRWAHGLRTHWPHLHLGALEVAVLQGRRRFSVAAYLGEIGPEDVEVQLYADASPPLRADAYCAPMQRADAIAGASQGHVYVLESEAAGPAGDFTARIVPRHPLAHVPIELGLIAWGR
ncbi:MAG: alpha-glucan family phosphorylase [Steroidobacteraceae bacterium]